VVGWGGDTLFVCRCDCRDWLTKDHTGFLKFLANIQGIEYERIGFESFERCEPLLLHSGACPSDLSDNFLLSRAHPPVAGRTAWSGNESIASGRSCGTEVGGQSFSLCVARAVGCEGLS